MSFDLISDGLCTDTTLPFAEDDDFLAGTNGGVHLFDTTKAFAYPAQAAPTNGAVVKDIARAAAGAVDGAAVVSAGVTMGWAGKGFAFDGITARGNGLTMPGGTMASLFAQQLGLALVYVKIPPAAEWSTTAGKFVVFMGSDSLVGANTDLRFTEAEFVSNGAGANRQSIWIRWPLDAAGTYGTLPFPDTEVPFGELAQVASWTVPGVGGARVGYGRIRSVSKDSTRFVGLATKNVADFSAAKMAVGRMNALTALDTAMSHRIYRGAWENLYVTGRDPVTVLNEDWTRVQASIAASAAANGGASQIFV